MIQQHSQLAKTVRKKKNRRRKNEITSTLDTGNQLRFHRLLQLEFIAGSFKSPLIFEIRGGVNNIRREKGEHSYGNSTTHSIG